jgi:1-acyl-sn-glycerol-3-phosphate acyltransferase
VKFGRDGLKKIINSLIIIRCCYIVIWSSFFYLIRLRFKRTPREWLNNYLHQQSIKILKILKIRYKIYLSQPLNFDPSKCYIFMSNHQSLIDLPLILTCIPGSIRFLAKQELFAIPLFGKALLKAECIPVARNNLKDNINFYLKAKEKLTNGLNLWIFPEGTRSKTGKLLPFKYGAFRLARELNADIIPIAIIGTNNVLPAGTLEINQNAVVELRVGKIINSKEYLTVNMQKKLVLDVRNEIEKLMT